MAPTPEFGESRQPPRGSVRILLLGDDPACVELVRQYLRRVPGAEAGLQVVSALREALERLTRQSFDLVIADLNLPDCSGLAIVERLARTSAQRIIVLSSEDDQELAAAALRSGAYECLSKSRLSEATLERLLRDSEARFRGLIQLSSDWYWEQDDELRFTRFEGRVTEISGNHPRGAIGKRRWEVPAIVPLSCTWDEHRAMLEARLPFREFEYSRVGDDGELRYISVSGEPLYDAEGRFRGYRGLASDITARKGAEHALRESEERFRALTELSSDWYWEQDETLRFTRFFGGIFKRIHIDPQTLIGRYRWENPGVDAKSPEWKAHRELLERREPFRDFEYAILQTNGEWLHMSVSGHPVFDQSGRFRGYRGVGRDITARWRAEAALRESEARFRALWETSPDAVLIMDEESVIRYASPAMSEVFGYAASEVVGKGLALLQPERFRTAHRAGVERYVRGGSKRLNWRSTLVTGRRKDGSEFPAEVAFSELWLGDRRYFAGYISDISERALAEERLRESQLLLEKTFEHMDQGISIAGAGLRIVGMNRRFRELLDFPEWLCQPNTPFEAFIRYNAERGDYGPGDVEEQVRTRVELARRFEAHKFERERPDGTIIEIRGAPLPGGGFVSIYTDVTERARAERALRESEARFRSLTELSADWYWEQDEQFRFSTLTGPGAAAMSRSGDPSVYLGKARWEIPDLEPMDGDWSEHRAQLERHEPFRDVVLRRRMDDGTTRYMSVGGEPVFDQAGRFSGYRGIAKNVTERVAAEQRVAMLAQFDALTGLPNRALLSDRFTQLIAQARRHSRSLGVLFIDLDQFKLVNDSLGHAGGDELLKETARRLQGSVRPGDTVARISGDEFAVILGDLARTDDAAIVAQKMIQRLAEPAEVRGRETFVTASIGIAVFPADGDDAETLLAAADAAMYRAKESGRNAYQFFTTEIDRRTRVRAQLGSDLRGALERAEFALAYQPKIDLASGAACGAEALLRWNHPQRGELLPGEFIPVLEETGLILPVGEWVLRRACTDLKAWQAAGLRLLPVAINLSARQFRQPDLDARIRSLVSGEGLDPSLIELEITESQLMQDPEHAIRVMRSLRDAGFRLAIDDFGTGYSSLAYLTRFPLTTLKIDRSFVAGIRDGNGDAVIVRTIIQMAHTLGFTVTAEGVEEQAQAAYLRKHGCEQAQGYLFARPMPATQLEQLIIEPALPEERCTKKE